jgi:nucleotide-binding universal stress UspA family protein
MDKRYKHILVPLDGSDLAELALADAFSLARLNQAEVTLFQVVRPVEEVLGAETGHPIFVDQQWENQRMLALEYLHSVCKRQRCENLPVHIAVEMGLAAESIIAYAHQQPIDLIVMATHGRSGLQRWVYGSVADKVLRGADVPVLLVRAHPIREAAWTSQ